ncbi:MAG TPA: hypothetical protein DDW26_12275 [Rhizobiales bacterium]|nr:hypothetical protein [Hyphomicrobiales bacterium]
MEAIRPASRPHEFDAATIGALAHLYRGEVYRSTIWFVDERYDSHFTPEELFGFIYAVFHSPTYRKKYAAFLRIDFPRVPFPDSADDFETLSQRGWALVQAHLLRELPRQELAAYHGKGDHAVETPGEGEPEMRCLFRPPSLALPHKGGGDSPASRQGARMPACVLALPRRKPGSSFSWALRALASGLRRKTSGGITPSAHRPDALSRL